MKRMLTIVLAAALLATGCAKPKPPADGKLHILCSTFPMYLFTRNVTQGAQNVDVQVMIPAAMGCPHDYSLTPQDMRMLIAADVFVVNGLGLEEFLDKAVRDNPQIRVLDSSAGVEGLLKFTPEEGGGDSHGHAHHQEYNPHLFAGPTMAAKVAQNIAQQLSKIDPANAAVYKANADAYAADLQNVAAELAAAVRNLPSRKIVTQHAVFDYLARDAGLEVVAVVEEEPGQEPSAAERTRLVQLIKKSGAAALFTEPQYPPRLGQEIAKEAGIPAASLDPSATGPDDAPMDYYQRTMRANIRTIVETLRGRPIGGSARVGGVLKVREDRPAPPAGVGVARVKDGAPHA